MTDLVIPGPRRRRVRPRPRGRWIAPVSRGVTLIAVVATVGLLPWLSGRDPALSVLRGTSADQEATPEALAAIRAQLGLDVGPLTLLARWWGGAVRGDFGTSWVSGRPVLPGVLDALGVSVTLMATALTVALLVTLVVAVPSFRAGLRGTPRRTGGGVAAALAALPEFLLASVLLLVGAVWLGWFPPSGWAGPSTAVLPAVALGLPAGGVMGRLLADAIAVGFTENWVLTWQVAGFTPRAVAAGVVRRALPGLLPQLGLVVVGLTGGAVAVETVFAVPGLGRLTLGAADAQDLPALQTGVLALVLLGIVAGGLADVSRRWLLAGVDEDGMLPVPRPTLRTGPAQWWVPGVAAAALAATVAWGWGRDPLTSAHARLAPPSVVLPFGADAAGRDVLARLAHGAVSTVAVALGVSVVCVVIGIVVGLGGRWAAGPVEVANAAPPVIAGLLVAAVVGVSAAGAAVAVTLVSWAPLAAHTRALVAEARAQPHITILPVLGLSRARILLTAVLPAVVGPVCRHGALRLPAVALALAALGFLGLGAAPPTPEWGLVLAEGMPYVERAPWAVLAPTGALIVLAVVAVGVSGWSRGRRGAA